jgi:hypothetical protein
MNSRKECIFKALTGVGADGGAGMGGELIQDFQAEGAGLRVFDGAGDVRGENDPTNFHGAIPLTA